jgi:hypothetical protein
MSAVRELILSGKMFTMSNVCADANDDESTNEKALGMRSEHLLSMFSVAEIRNEMDA